MIMFINQITYCNQVGVFGWLLGFCCLWEAGWRWAVSRGAAFRGHRRWSTEVGAGNLVIQT